MKINIILGTRPEIIKMSPLIRLCEKNKIDYFVTHTGQHYSYALDRLFFKDLELPTPKYNLEVGSASHARQTASMMEKIETILEKEKPGIVLVQGDTNSALAGALCAVKMGTKTGHVEAGLRSYDRSMPEEINRVVIDHVSDYLFCPTEESRKIAIGEGISKEKISVTGNTIADAVFQNLEISKKKQSILNKIGVQENNFILLTTHRPGNVDKKEKLALIISEVAKAGRLLQMPVVFPAHPRTRKMIEEFSIQVPENFVMIEPVGFLEFLQIEANAALILTDSGGVQEEACILKVPCVTLRENTERPETIIAGANILAGNQKSKIAKYSMMMYRKKRAWNNPFGNGNASEKILNKLQIGVK